MRALGIKKGNNIQHIEKNEEEFIYKISYNKYLQNNIIRSSNIFHCIAKVI